MIVCTDNKNVEKRFTIPLPAGPRNMTTILCSLFGRVDDGQGSFSGT